MPADADDTEDLALECHARLHQGLSASVEDVCGARPELVPAVRRRLAAMLRREGAFRLDTTAPDTTPGPAAPEPVALPAAIGGYRPVRLLARGGMGVVYLADDPTRGRQVALKVMLPARAAEADARARFLREARAAAALDHPHVMPLLAVAEANGCPFLVMPYLPGEALDARLARGPLPPADLVRLGVEVALGLAAAHAIGLVHRDLKPSNVWLEAGPPWRARVLDFGLARDTHEVDRLTRSGTFLGTLRYTAPEQALDAGAADARCDLYSLGVVLYEAATGRAPGGRESLADLLDGLDAGPPPREPLDAAGIPAPVAGLILRLLQPDPAARPASATAVADELRAGESFASLEFGGHQPGA